MAVVRPADRDGQDAGDGPGEGPGLDLALVSLMGISSASFIYAIDEKHYWSNDGIWSKGQLDRNVGLSCVAWRNPTDRGWVLFDPGLSLDSMLAMGILVMGDD